MRTIKVFLASSEELEIERLKFADLILQLNRSLKPRGIEIELAKWEYLDSSMGKEHKQEEYNKELKTCEMCLVLYWTRFGDYTKIELDTAYNELCAGNNPKKLYVFFKDTKEISPELKEFRDSFDTEYGHFYCRFENVDTMRLQFLLQFEDYQNKYITKRELLEIKDSQVAIDGMPFVRLEDLEFAANNPEYQQLLKDIVSAQRSIEKYPDDLEFRTHLRELKDRQLQMERNLLNTAQLITQFSGNISSERFNRAIELFQAGDNKGACALLNEKDIIQDAESNIERIKQACHFLGQAQNSLKTNIYELCLKIQTISNMMDEGWIDKVIELYDQIMAYSPYVQVENRVEYLHMYVRFLKDQRIYNESSEKLFQELIELLKDLYSKDNKWIFLLGQEMNSYGHLLWEKQKHDKAISVTQEAFDILSSYKYWAEPIQGDLMILVNNNLASYYGDSQMWEKAKEKFEKSLEVIEYYLSINSEDNSKLLDYKIYALFGLIHIHKILNQTKEVSDEIEEVLKIHQTLKNREQLDSKTEILLLSRLGKYKKDQELLTLQIEKLRELALDNPNYYLPELGNALKDFADLLREKGQLKRSLSVAKESLQIALKFHAKDSITYSDNLSDIYETISHIYYDNNDYTTARAYSEKAVSALRDNPKSKRGRYQLAYALQQRGDMLEAMHEYEASESAYLESLSILRKLKKEDDEIGDLNLQKILGYLARVRCALKKYMEAEENILESYELASKLYVKGFISFKDLFRILELRCRIYDETQNKEALIETLKESLTLCETQLSLDPNEYGFKIAHICNEIVDLYLKDGNYPEAEAYITKGTDICRCHIEPFDFNYVDKLIDLLYYRSVILIRKKENITSMDVMQEVIDLSRRMIEHGHNGYTPYLAARLKDLGDVKFICMDYAEYLKTQYFSQNAVEIESIKEDFVSVILQLKEAESHYKESIDIFNTLPENTKYLESLSSMYLNLARIHTFTADDIAVEHDYTQAIEYYSKLLDSNSRTDFYLSELGAIHNNLGMHYGKIGKIDKQIQCIRQAIVYTERIQTKKVQQIANLALLYVNLGITLVENNESEEALTQFTRALDLRVNLAQYNPQYLEYVANLLLRMANLSFAMGKIFNAEIYRREALYVYEQSQLESSQYEEDIENLTNNINKFQVSSSQKVNLDEEALQKETDNFLSKLFSNYQPKSGGSSMMSCLFGRKKK